MDAAVAFAGSGTGPELSYLDHIARCNAYDPGGFRPLLVDGRRVGAVRHRSAELLAEFGDVFAVTEAAVALAPALDTYRRRTEAVDRVLRTLRDRGGLGGWRGERYPVGGSWGGPHDFEIERAAAPFLGTRAYGVHVNGFVRDGDGLFLWIGRRADDRPVCPGELDNMVAGGQPVGLGLLENVVKEAGEEAAVPAALAATARPVGAVTYVMEDDLGLKPDVMFCWDLEVPADFVPVNHDGEITEFRLLPVAEVMEIVDTTSDFKFNCNLVNIDFFVRHGTLPADHPDYVEIVRGLRR